MPRRIAPISKLIITLQRILILSNSLNNYIPMRTITVNADVEIAIDDLDFNEILPAIPTHRLRMELAGRMPVAGELNEKLEALSEILRLRPEDRRNKGKIVEAIIEL